MFAHAKTFILSLHNRHTNNVKKEECTNISLTAKNIHILFYEQAVYKMGTKGKKVCLVMRNNN